MINTEHADEVVEIVNAFEEMKYGFESMLKVKSVTLEKEGEDIKKRAQSKVDGL